MAPAAARRRLTPAISRRARARASMRCRSSVGGLVRDLEATRACALHAEGPGGGTAERRSSMSSRSISGLGSFPGTLRRGALVRTWWRRFSEQSRRRARARATRDSAVPVGTLMTAAASSKLSPATTRKSAFRWSAGRIVTRCRTAANRRDASACSMRSSTKPRSISTSPLAMACRRRRSDLVVAPHKVCGDPGYPHAGGCYCGVKAFTEPKGGSEGFGRGIFGLGRSHP